MGNSGSRDGMGSEFFPPEISDDDEPVGKASKGPSVRSKRRSGDPRPRTKPPRVPPGGKTQGGERRRPPRATGGGGAGGGAPAYKPPSSSQSSQAEEEIAWRPMKEAAGTAPESGGGETSDKKSKEKPGSHDTATGRVVERGMPLCFGSSRVMDVKMGGDQSGAPPTSVQWHPMDEGEVSWSQKETGSSHLHPINEENKGSNGGKGPTDTPSQQQPPQTMTSQSKLLVSSKSSSGFTSCFISNRNLTPGTPTMSDRTKAVQMETGSAVPSPPSAPSGASHDQGRKPTRTANIFASPMQVSKNFKPPVYKKGPRERQFLKQVLANHFIFGRMNSRQLHPLIMAFEEATYQAGDTVISQGEVGDYFFILYEGSCRYEIDGQTVVKPLDGSKQVAGPGDCMGDLSLLYTSLRPASVVAETTVTLFRVDQMTFRKTIEAQIKQTDDEKKMLLRDIPFLKDLDDDAIQKLSSAFVPRTFEKDEFLVTKDDSSVADTFYVLQEGKARVTDITVGGESMYEDYTIGPGDYFGERAMLRNEPRTANVIALTEGVALGINKAAFDRVFGNFNNFNMREHDKRSLATIKVIKESFLKASELALVANAVVDRKYPKGNQICTRGRRAEAALYLIHEGSVKISAEDGTSRVVEEGGYFGDEQLLIDSDNTNKNDVGRRRHAGGASGSVLARSSTLMLKYTAEALDDCLCGVLTLSELRTIVDTRFLGVGQRMNFGSVLETDIQLHELRKRRLLGEGTFGQVWLATRGADDTTPYAMKIQSKKDLIQYNHVEGVIRERKIMGRLHHPFTMRLVNTYKDNYFLYMLLQFVQGGELLGRYEATQFQGLPADHSLFYAACIFDALFHMHRRMIVYRDLKPENVLIDAEGYIIIADFGFAKIIEDKTHTFCGSPMYMAPEVILQLGHGKAADNWSLGVMIFELLTGETPFYEEGMDKVALFRQICKGTFTCPRKKVGPFAKDLIHQLLRLNPQERIGSLSLGEREIASHPWFSEGGIVWDKLRKKELMAPWLPDVGDHLDVSNFEAGDFIEDKTDRKVRVSPADDRLFDEF